MIDYEIINKCDFPILKVNNFISDDLMLIKKEIIKLSAETYNTNLITREYDRVYLDYYYENDRTQSDILKITTKYLFSSEMTDIYRSIKEGAFKLIEYSSQHESQLTFYGDKHGYEWHQDIEARWFINWILYIDIDSDFTGGENQISNDELSLGNDNTPYNIDISTKPKDNMLIMMPSWVTHRVAPVFCKSKDKLKSRITINGHIGYSK